MPILTKKDFLKGYPENYSLIDEQEANSTILVSKANQLQKILQHPFTISSGFRSEEHNKRVGGSETSLHKLFAAVDILDPDSWIAKILVEKSFLLEELDLYMEHPKYTKGYVHLQIFPPKSRRRIFPPYNREPIASKFNKLFKDLKV